MILFFLRTLPAIFNSKIGELMVNVYQIGTMQIALQSKSSKEAYLETALGAFRSLQFCDKLFSFMSLSGYAKDFLTESARVCNRGWAALSIPRVPGAFGFMREEFAALSQMSAIPGSTIRKYVNLVQATSSFAAVTCYASAPFISAAGKTMECSKILRFGGIASCVADTYDFQKNIFDLRTAHNLTVEARKVGANPELLTALTQTRTLNALKTVKSINALAGFVLGGGISRLGAIMFPGAGVVLAAMSLAGSVLAISASVYEDRMQNSRVNFFSDKHVQHLEHQVA